MTKDPGPLLINCVRSAAAELEVLSQSDRFRALVAMRVMLLGGGPVEREQGMTGERFLELYDRARIEGLNATEACEVLAEVLRARIDDDVKRTIGGR